MKDEQGVIVNATKGQIEEFKDSILWKDIRRELEMWKEGCKDEYEQTVGDSIASGNNILTHLGDIHGRGMSIDYFLSILDVFLAVLEDKNEDETKEEKEIDFRLE
jgi:hypothetical protein